MPGRESGLFIDGDVKDLELIEVGGISYLVAGKNGGLMSVYAVGGAEGL